MLSTKHNPILLMNGPPRTGKNFAEQLLEPHINIVQFALADAVKLTVLFAHGLVGEAHPATVDGMLDEMEADKSKSRKALGNQSWRQALIKTAETYRLLYGDGFWAATAVRKVRQFDEAYSALRGNSRPAMLLITDIGFPGDLRAFEEAFPERSMLLRTHRQGKTFGKLPGFEQAYGADTGEDSRNYVFANRIPSADWLNDGNEGEGRFDLIELLGDNMGWEVVKRLTLERNDKLVNVARLAKQYKVPQSIQMAPFEQPKMYWPDLTTFIGQDLANLNVVNRGQAA